MWWREFKDYPPDTPLVKEQVESNHGIVGCEMHELNGWGNTLQQPQKKKRGILASLILALFGE